MPRTNWQNHGSTEILSTHIAGAYEAIGKMEDIFNFGTQARTGVTLTCVDTAWRIYESPVNRRNWTNAPVTVRRNGNVVATGFRIDFGGGAIIFDSPLVNTDIVTADFTHVDNVNLGTFPPTAHNHDTAAITTGTLPVGRGGTGATTLTGVVVGTGTAALSAVAAPAGAIVGTTDTQTLTNKTHTAPRITSASNIADSAGNELIIFPATVAAAVNEITISNAATGVSPSVTASGNDINISLNLIPKGTGTVQVNGVTVPTVSSTDTLTNKSLTSPTLTGTPTAPTAALDTSTTQIASTAFVIAQASATTPLINGTAAAGASLRYSRADHVHGTDTGRAAAVHNHAASEITSGSLTVAQGGTGATTHTAGNVLIGNAAAAVTSLSRSGIDSRASFPPDSHVHGAITNAGAIGSTANLPIITGASGVLAAGAFGSTINTFCQGNDARLSDARTPTVHGHGETSAPNPNTFMQRDAAGRAQVAVPAVAADIARLDTVTAHTSLTNNPHAVTAAQVGATPIAHEAATAVHSATSAATADRIVMRDASGRAQVAAPAVAADIARLDTVTTHAALTTTAHGAVSAPTINTIILRDASGRAQVAAPAVAADIARLDTVTAHTSLTNNPHAVTAAQLNIFTPNRRLYTGDETEKSHTGTVLTTVMTTRVISSSSNAFRVTNVRVCAELLTTAGTGFIEVWTNGSHLFTLSTSSTSYVLVQGSLAVAWADNTVNIVEIRLRNSASNITRVRTCEIYVEAGA